MGNQYRGLLLLLFSLVTVLKAHAQIFAIDTLQYNGNTANYINLVILGDGYTKEQLITYTADARNFTNYLFDQAPYNAYKTYFNVFAIRVPSLESGVKHPRTASDCLHTTIPVSDPENFFGTTFDVGNIHRLVAPTEYNKIGLVLASHLPEYDQVVILANTPDYGGSGGAYATATLHASSNEIAIHEISHSFAGLADEYWAGAVYAAEKPNMTQVNSPDLIKWKNWLTPDTGIGIHQHAGQTWYKPTQNACKMETLGREFCAVCVETIIARIYTLIKPVYTTAPAKDSVIMTTPSSPAFYVSLQEINPRPPTLKARWSLNDAPLADHQDSIQIVPTLLPEGENHLSVTLMDTTGLNRSETYRTKSFLTLSWTLSHSKPLPVRLTTFTAKGSKGGVTLTWSTAMEVNNDRFEIERSTDGLDWEVIGTVKGHGTSTLPKQYFFYDHRLFRPSGPTIYYRLKQVDWNNSFVYSAVKAVRVTPLAAQVRLLGNPVGEQLHFEISGPVAAPVTLRIDNLDGSRVIEWPVPMNGLTPAIKVPVARLLPGVYIYSLYQQTGVLDIGKFVKIN